ncbi:hypothetical protein CVT26_003499 [Gymnopilus dilepis]|uniref:Uncharacterized protein n=1 Tax=Gymnopilus dilepis TaxID=231916 RepID=A0A409W340_9AGAR|nr:hypothetical protein CVT26_003499 [Gymnopilus dilepis]
MCKPGNVPASSHNMTESDPKFPPNALSFYNKFPHGRLCRIVNRRSGTLLDVRSYNLVNDAVPQVVGKFLYDCVVPFVPNPEDVGVQYWIITPHGDGQAIVVVPRDGSDKVLYLVPSSVNETKPVTVSPFPASWQIIPTSDCPPVAGSPLTGSTVPQGLYEEWTCQISWPHYRNGEPRMLDCWAGLASPNNPVVIYPLSGTQWQYWKLQFIHLGSGAGGPNDGCGQSQ